MKESQERLMAFAWRRCFALGFEDFNFFLLTAFAWPAVADFLFAAMCAEALRTSGLAFAPFVVLPT